MANSQLPVGRFGALLLSVNSTASGHARIVDDSRATHSNWNAEDTVAWQAGNEKIARRNLVWSLFAMHVGYSVWSIWPVVPARGGGGSR